MYYINKLTSFLGAAASPNMAARLFTTFGSICFLSLLSRFSPSFLSPLSSFVSPSVVSSDAFSTVSSSSLGAPPTRAPLVQRDTTGGCSFAFAASSSAFFAAAAAFSSSFFSFSSFSFSSIAAKLDAVSTALADPKGFDLGAADLTSKTTKS